MELSWESLDNYRKNMWCIREVMDKLLGSMKGHGYSFRPDITDKEGNFDNEKLHALVTDLLNGWEDYVRDGLYPARSSEENPAEPYLRARRELYSLYLYLAMRSSLCEGAYALTSGREDEKERTDFAFILEQARRFSQNWCVMAGPDESRRNEPYEGFDSYFGFHLYRVLTDPEGKTSDSTLTPYGKAPMQNLSNLTNEGAMKRIYCKRLAPPPRIEKTATENAQNVSEEPMDDADYDEDYGGDYEPEEDGWEQTAPFGIFADGELEWLSEEDNRTSWLTSLAMRFDGREEYISACGRFVTLYRQTPAEVLRGFADELEEIVNLYLLRRGLTALADTDKTLDIYSRVYDGPGRQAKRYERGILWNSL